MKTFFTFLIFNLSFLIFNSKAQWIELDPGVDVPYFTDVYAITPDIVVVVGANGTILKTTDGGETWIQKESGTTENLQKVQFLTPEVGYVIGNSGILLKTTDGGETWISIDTGQTANFEGLSIVDESLIFISYYNNLIKSEDGGNTWVNYSMNSFFYNYIQFFNSLIGYSAKESGSLAKTIDGGQTWQELSGFIPFYFLNENIGFYHDGGLLKTIDGGNNFGYIGSGINELFSNIIAINENIIWGIFAGLLNGDGTTRGIIKISNNETYTETIAWDNNPQIDMLSIHFANEITGYIAGYKDGKGAIWKNGTGINTMGINEVEKNNGIKVYPNPASKEINIEFNKLLSENTTVSFTDLSGKKVFSKTYINLDKITINTAALPKGIYILSVKSEQGNFSQKIIIH